MYNVQANWKSLGTRGSIRLIAVVARVRKVGYSLLGRDYPVPAKLLEVDGELVSTAPGLLAGFVAIKSYVSFDPRPPFWSRAPESVPRGTARTPPLDWSRLTLNSYGDSHRGRRSLELHPDCPLDA